MQYILINFVNIISFSIRCAMCLWRWPKSCCIFTINDYDGCFSACSYNLSYYWLMFILLILLICFHEYLSFFEYDVGFVDVVKFGYRNFYDTNFSVFTRLYFFSVLHNTYFIMSVMCSILFDPGRCYCYWDSIKPCKSNEFRLVAYGSVTRG